jgi:hypothetical protein
LGGPEWAVDVVSERAPISQDELAAISKRYAKMAGSAGKKTALEASHRADLLPVGSLRAARDICSRFHGSASRSGIGCR